MGNRCTGARVNSKIVPLTTTLEVGDVVEIITSPNSKGPSRDWLKFIKSSSAKAKIKQFYKNELKEDNIRIGQAKLEEEAKKKGYALSELLTEESFKRISDRYSFGGADEMYAAVGYGSVSVNQVLFKLIDFYKKEMPKPFEVHAGDGGGRTPAACWSTVNRGCWCGLRGAVPPVPGDEIVGFTSRGRGVVIHRAGLSQYPRHRGGTADPRILEQGGARQAPLQCEYFYPCHRPGRGAVRFVWRRFGHEAFDYLRQRTYR